MYGAFVKHTCQDEPNHGQMIPRRHFQQGYRCDRPCVGARSSSLLDTISFLNNFSLFCMSLSWGTEFCAFHPPWWQGEALPPLPPLTARPCSVGAWRIVWHDYGRIYRGGTGWQIKWHRKTNSCHTCCHPTWHQHFNILTRGNSRLTVHYSTSGW